MTVLEYFISTHGARKGLADTALRTADSGYLTRRLVDVAQDVITREDDCGTEEGSWITRERVERREGRLPAPARRPPGRRPAAGPVGQGQEGRGAAARRRSQREITEEIAARIDAAGIDEVLVRSPLTCEARYGVCRACYGRNLATGEHGRLGRGGRHHRRPVDRRAGHPADDADVPHRRRRRPGHHRRPAARRGAVRGPRPQGQGRDQPHRRHRRDHPRRHRPTKVKVISTRGLRHVARRCPRAPSCWPPPATRSRLDQVVARSEVGRRARPTSTSPVKGFLVKGDDGLVVRAEDVVEREYPIPHNAKLLVENGQEIRAGDAHHRRPDQPAGVPRDPGQGRRPALPGQGSPEGLPEPGRHDQRQAHRDHRPADAPQGPHRPAGRRRPAPDRADRPARLRGGQQPRPGRGRRAGDGPDRAARRDQGVAQHLVASSPRRPSRRRPGCSPRPPSTAPRTT